jgi:raffinose/stachyose/melibiose transport system substrate-binding protein
MLGLETFRSGMTVATAAALLATGVLGGSTMAQSDTAAADEVRAACAGAGDVTLKVGFSEAGEVILEEFRKQAAAFQDAYPNVTVEVNAKDWASSYQTIRLAMSGDDPPDVMQGNEGWAIDGALWEAGLILDLDDYAAAFGWEEKFPESALMVNRFSDDASIMGEGNLVAVPPAMQYVGVFYNKEKLASLGVTDVSTIDSKDAFLALLDAAKAAGELPVMLGDSDKWPALHNLSLLTGWYVEPDAINAWVFNKEGATYNDAGHIQAAQDFQDWMSNGYFNPDALAISFNDAVARFGEGEGVFYIGGTWALGDIYRSMGDNAGFMLFPAGPRGTHAAVGGYSLPFIISSRTENPDCAAAFIDFVTASPEAIQAQIAAGRPSATKAGTEVAIDNPLLAQMVSEFKKLSEESGLFTWEDWPTPTMGTLMMSESQLLLGDQITPEEYVKTVQDDWDEFMASRGE